MSTVLVRKIKYFAYICWRPFRITKQVLVFPNNFRIKFSILVHYGVVSWDKLDSAAIRASNLHSDSSNPTVDLLKATTASS